MPSERAQNRNPTVRPAGMTYERALEIATSVLSHVTEGLEVLPDRQKVESLHRQGLSNGEMSTVLKMPRATVYFHVDALGLTPHRGLRGRKPAAVSEELNERVTDLHAQGLDDAAIAAVIGTERKAVRARRSRLGLPTISTRSQYAAA